MLLNKVCNFVLHTVNMHYINQQMHLMKYNKVQITKYNSRQLSNSCMFRQEGAILRDFIRSKQHKYTTPPATIYLARSIWMTSLGIKQIDTDVCIGICTAYGM
jgi:hypothetical protein